MKITYGAGRALENMLYMEQIVAELKAKRTIKPPIIGQQASTQATLDRDPSLDIDHWNRLVGPMPDGWIAVPDAKTDEERVAMRHIDPKEASHIEAIRRRPKNSIGQSELSAINEISRYRAIEGFVYTPPANVTKKEVEDRAVNLVQYKSEPMKEIWVEMNWFEALIHKIRGNKVKSLIKDK